MERSGLEVRSIKIWKRSLTGSHSYLTSCLSLSRNQRRVWFYWGNFFVTPLESNWKVDCECYLLGTRKKFRSYQTSPAHLWLLGKTKVFWLPQSRLWKSLSYLLFLFSLPFPHNPQVILAARQVPASHHQDLDQPNWNISHLMICQVRPAGVVQSIIFWSDKACGGSVQAVQTLLCPGNTKHPAGAG